MASCITPNWSGNAVNPQVRLTVTQSASTATTATLSWVLEYVAYNSAAQTGSARAYSVVINGSTVKSGTYDINGVTTTKTIASGTCTISKGTSAKSIPFSCSFNFNLTWSGVYGGTKTASGSISVAAKTSYTIKYNANGGSGVPSNQTKWHGTNLTLSSTKPTRTGYSFKNWNTSSGGGGTSYASGGTYSANAAATLYAQWSANTYPVSYDANGGTGAPSTQTKYYGTALKLSSTTPTRTNYTFKGWGTSASATTVSYSPGGSYTANARITLYAIWELSYVKPRITGVQVYRAAANNLTPADDGQLAVVQFAWATDQNISSIKINHKLSTDDEWIESTTEPGGTTSGSVRHVIDRLSIESTYTIQIIVTDTNGYSAITRTIVGLKLAFDTMPEAKGVAMGKPAELEGVADIGYQTRMLGGIMHPVLEPETDLNEVLTPNTYIGANITNNNYGNCPVTTGTFTLIVEGAGEEGQVRQTYISCSKYKPERYIRFYYQGTWGNWFNASSDEVVLYENESGSGETITLAMAGETATAASNYRYLEIYYTDNNGKSGGYTKVWKPNGKTVCLSIVEAGSSVWMRQTTYTISGATITPNVGNASYIKFSGTSFSITSGTNYIKIVRVIGRA